MAFKRSRKTYEEDLQKQESPFVVYGTPLPPLDDDVRDDGTFVPVWKQEATDDRGRKRLHGAFTGGFSAGYFNTVGSKEGWTPSTFVSSRSNRAKDQKSSAQPRPEDFMDEEDIREQEESRQLSTADGFAGFGTEDDLMHNNTLMDLFRSSEDSMGVKLLNKMGWKQGQGIGPRVRRNIDGDEEDSETHLFAPDDVPMISFNKKNDFKGLGYDGEAGPGTSNIQKSSVRSESAQQSDQDEDDSRPGLSFMGGRRKTAKSTRSGFGVGILNDTGSDEEDPYSMGPKISYNKTLGSDKKSKKKATTAISAANPLLKSKPTFIPKKLASLQHNLRKCHDGRLPLTGFVLADELDSFSSMSLSDDKYKPPEIPADWRSARLPAYDAVSPGAQQSPVYQSTSDAAKQSTHTSATRADLLGEQRLPGKSIYDFLTPEAREKLMKATGKKNLPPALSERLPLVDGDTSGTHNELVIEVPYLDALTAKSALSRAESGGFIPYAEDLDKRARYKHFLELASGLLPEETQPMKPSSTSGAEEWMNELNEFVRAAEVFRPMTGAIASRFTSSSSTVLDPESSGTDSENLVRKPISKPEDPAEVAAKLGMFGVMTRLVSSFQPTRLVCKRFGVDMPMYMPQETSRHFTSPTASMPMPPANSTPAPEASSANNFQSAGFITNGKLDSDQSGTLDASMQDVNGVGHDRSGGITSDAVIDPEKNEAIEQEKPGQAVFRAIFGDSDSDDE